MMTHIPVAVARSIYGSVRLYGRRNEVVDFGGAVICLCGIRIENSPLSLDVERVTLGMPTCPRCAVLRDEALEGRLPVADLTCPSRVL